MLTGVPRGISRCLSSLAPLLDDYDVDYFAVLREEFATGKVLGQLKKMIPGVTMIVVPAAETERGVASAADPEVKRKMMPTVIQMWHEVWYGASQIPTLAEYDWVFRTRFDVRFAPQFLPEIEPVADTVWLPQQLCWSGSNDMMCLAGPKEFKRYANVFIHLKSLEKQGVRVPEHIISRSLHAERLSERSLDVNFFLFREELHDELTDEVLDTLCFTQLANRVFKVGRKTDTPEARQSFLQEVAKFTERDSLFPLYEIPHMSGGYKPEIDPRDRSVFRYIDLHFYMRRALQNVRGIRFKIHYVFKGWDLDLLTVTIDGYPVNLSIVDVDKHGRPTVYGEIEPGFRFRRPMSKIGIASTGARVPADKDPNSTEKRRLSIGIGMPELLTEPLVPKTDKGFLERLAEKGRALSGTAERSGEART